MKILIRVVVVLLLLGAVVGITWWAAGTKPKPTLSKSEAPDKPRIPEAPAASTGDSPFAYAPKEGDPNAEIAPVPRLGQQKYMVGNMDPDIFEEKLTAVLVNDAISHDAAANILLDMLPAATVDQQVELSEHASNLLDDAQYNRVRDLLLNPAIHPDVKEVWYSDMLNRDSLINVPLLGEVAKQTDNPFSQEAIDTLSIILDPEIADNPALIDGAVKQFVEDAKAEEAALADDAAAAK